MRIFNFQFSIFKTLIFLSIIVLFFLLPLQSAKAEVPVKCQKCSTESTLKDFSKKEVQNTKNIFSEQLKEFNHLINNASLKNTLTNNLVNQILQWIQGKAGTGNCAIDGINGPIVVPCNQQNQPKFVKNWEEFLGNASQEGANRFLSDLGGAKFCPSSGGVDTKPIIQDLLKKQSDSSFAERTSCSVPGNNTNVFQAGGSGWEGWLKLNEPGGNDFFSNLLLSYDEEANNAEAKKEAAKSEAESGQGFLGEKKCKNETTRTVFHPDGTSETKFVCLDTEITTPASTVAGLNQRASESQFEVIANSEDLSGYLSTLASSIFSLISNIGLKDIPAGSVGSGNAPISGGGGGLSLAEQLCAPFKNAAGTSPKSATSAQPRSEAALGKTETVAEGNVVIDRVGTTNITTVPGVGITTQTSSSAYQDCIRAVQSGQDITKFAKDYLLGLIDDELQFLNAIRQTKQSTANTLAQSIDTLNQANSCQTSIAQNPKTTSYVAANPGTVTTGFFNQIILNTDIAARNTIVRQIIDLQKRINDLNKQRSVIRALTDKDVIANALADYKPTLGPGEGQSKVEDAQQELNAVQANLITDQGNLLNCQSLKSAIESFNVSEGLEPKR